MSTRVVHVKRDAHTVYIGRPMPDYRSIGWGNPFRGEGAIAKYRRWLQQQPKLLARLPELKDQVLGCWCAPKGGLPGDINGRICHGQVLAALADGATCADSDQMAAPPVATPSGQIIRALSLIQPWASLVSSGAKRIETRSWQPGPRGGLRRGERLAIHASKGFPDDARKLCEQEPFASALLRAGVVEWRELPVGCVVATVQFDQALPTNTVFNLPDDELAFGNFAPGRFAWFLSDPRPVRPPVPARGSLGLWTLRGNWEAH